MAVTAKHPNDKDLSLETPLYRRITALLVRAGWRVGKDAEGTQQAEAARTSVG